MGEFVFLAMVESAEEITGGAMTGESEGHIRDLDAQLAQNRHVQWCRLLNPASTTPFCPFGSTMVGVAGVSGGPEPEPGLRPGGFMGSEPCRGLVTRQFGSGVGSSDGGWTGSGRVRCGGSCETWRWWCEKSAVETRDSLAQIICVLGCPRSAAWLVSGLGEILHPFGFDRGKAAHRSRRHAAFPSPPGKLLKLIRPSRGTLVAALCCNGGTRICSMHPFLEALESQQPRRKAP
jgi:hypothetical protein